MILIRFGPRSCFYGAVRATCFEARKHRCMCVYVNVYVLCGCMGNIK